jgi:hypothetical protein
MHNAVRPSLARRLLARSAIAACLLIVAASALLYPTEATINVVGGILLLLQIGALAIVLNPLARWRLASGVFLVVSGLLIYWSYWFEPDVPFFPTASERFWAAPIGESWNILLNRLTNYYPENDPEWWKQRPSGPSLFTGFYAAAAGRLGIGGGVVARRGDQARAARR